MKWVKSRRQAKLQSKVTRIDREIEALSDRLSRTDPLNQERAYALMAERVSLFWKRNDLYRKLAKE